MRWVTKKFHYDKKFHYERRGIGLSSFGRYHKIFGKINIFLRRKQTAHNQSAFSGAGFLTSGGGPT